VIEEREELPELPNGWIWTRIGEIGELIRGVSYSKAEASKVNRDRTVPILRATNIGPQLSYDNLVYVPCDRVKDEQRIKAFDIVIAMSSGSKELVGKAAQAMQDFEGAIGVFCGLLRVSSEADRKFVGLFFRSTPYRTRISQHSSGVNINNLRREHVLSTPMPLPPLNEQVRIVARVEELFAFLNAGMDAVLKVKVQLKRYRQAVLKYAFEGKLTEEWRKTYNHETEPATKLLQQIEQEKRKSARYKELPSVDMSDLPKLPESWTWTRLGAVTKRMQYGTSEKASMDPSGIPVLRMGNIQEGRIVFNDLKYFPWDWPQVDEFLLGNGDVLFNRTNSAELVGKTAVYREHYPKAVFASYLIRVETYKVVYDPEVLSFFINSFYGRQYMSAVVSQQVGQANVNGMKLSLMPIPLIPYQEQVVLRQQIDSCFSVAEEMGKITERSLKQAEHMRQSILKLAFEGRLVPQDAMDESAEKLLERVKREKTEFRNEKTAKRRKTESQQLELFSRVE